MLIKVDEKKKFNPNRYKNYDEKVYDGKVSLHSRPYGDTPFAREFWENLKREKDGRA